MDSRKRPLEAIAASTIWRTVVSGYPLSSCFPDQAAHGARPDSVSPDRRTIADLTAPFQLPLDTGVRPPKFKELSK